MMPSVGASSALGSAPSAALVGAPSAALQPSPSAITTVATLPTNSSSATAAFPSFDEAKLMITIHDVMEWLQTPGDAADPDTLRGSLLNALGASHNDAARDVGAGTEQDFISAVQSCQVNGTNLSFMLKSKANRVGKICRYLASPEAQAPAPPAQRPVVLPKPPGLPPAPPVRTVALSETVSQTEKGEAPLMDKFQFASCLTRWQSLFGSGERADPGCEPTIEQLSSIVYLVKEDRPPYVDFSTWGPPAPK